MSYANGRLPGSVLAPIAGGRLRRDAAAAWNAMNAESRRRFGVTLYPLGPASSYRTLAQQYSLFRTSRPGWAAQPGTSNHGWGLAVDVASRQMRSVVDQIGRRFGFSKACSDASWEWWHIKWNPACTGASFKVVVRRDWLKGLTKRERFMANRLIHHRRVYARQARSGKGPRYRLNWKWANFWRVRIQRHMQQLRADARKTGWHKSNRGGRYQTLLHVVQRKIR